MKLTRGDTGQYKFQRLDTDGTVIATTPDAIYFTVKQSFGSPSFVFQKTLDDMTMDEDGYWHFVVDPSDTESLDYGTYVYDIEVTESTYVQTIAKGTFQLTAEATWYINK